MGTEVTARAGVEPVDGSPLRRLCGGQVQLPGDERYDAARLAWSSTVDQRPAAVVHPRCFTDISEVVRCAAGLGLRVAPQSTGHGAAALSARGLADVVLLKTGQLDEVVVDEERRVVRVGGGARWDAVVEAVSDTGLSVVHGASPSVGVAGDVLGGGLGWYARKRGLVANSVTAIEVVDSRGMRVRADAETNPQLFWALRGGGGSFGVVTALELRLFEVTTAYAGRLVWDISRAEQVLRTWAGWADEAPDEVTASFRILRRPSMPGIAAGLHDRDVVVVDAAVTADEGVAAGVLAPLRALGPELDSVGPVPTRELVRLQADPARHAAVTTSSATLRALPEEAIQAFLAVAGPEASTALAVSEIRQLGGALGRPAPRGGVVSHLDGRFLVRGVAIAPTPDLEEPSVADDAAGLTRALAAYSDGRTFLGLADEPVDVRSGFPASAWVQLTGIRSAMDPDGLFVGNHPVPRLFEDGHPTA